MIVREAYRGDMTVSVCPEHYRGELPAPADAAPLGAVLDARNAVPCEWCAEQRPEVVTVGQVGGGVRFLALAPDDARAVRRDRAMLDGVTALACLDVQPDGSAAWQWPSGCANTPEGKAAIREHRAALQDHA